MKAPRVLLIDDEVGLIQNISQLLKHRGYEASIAGNGEEGLRAIREKQFDVVVLDLRMPGISGMDVLREIKTEKAGSPEVIILTGFGTVDSGLEGLQLGASDYLTKPIKIGELVEKIAEAFHRKIIKDGIL
ncbi:MAG: response regulator [Desulfobacteraceae bacterium]|nr:response regulator [Desulfobacteraceae bacterium]